MNPYREVAPTVSLQPPVRRAPFFKRLRWWWAQGPKRLYAATLRRAGDAVGAVTLLAGYDVVAELQHDPPAQGRIPTYERLAREMCTVPAPVDWVISPAGDWTIVKCGCAADELGPLR